MAPENKTVKIELFVKKDSNTLFEGHNYVGRFSRVKGTTLGYGSYVGSKSNISNSVIGKYTSIGSNVCFINGRHPVSEFVSTHPAFYSVNNAVNLSYVKSQKFQEFVYADEQKHDVAVGNDVWIGNNVSVIAGVTIGDGAVVLAGAVVTKNVEPYSVVGGVPAQEIKKRFDSETVSKLLSLKWWELGEDILKNCAELFSDSNALIGYLEEINFNE